MQDDVSYKQLPPSAPRKEPGVQASPLLSEAPAIISGTSPPVSQVVTRGGLPRWLLVTLVGMLALAVLASGTGLLISHLHSQPNQAPPPVLFISHPARSNQLPA